MVWGKMASSRVRVSAPAGSGKGMDKLVRYGKVRQDFVAKRRTAIFGLGLLKLRVEIHKTTQYKFVKFCKL
jgi:hypothetical protein